MKNIDYDTIYIFIKSGISAGKAVSQTAHAVGLLASAFPDVWGRHVQAGHRAVALRAEKLPFLELHLFHQKVEIFESTKNGLIHYASVYDHTDSGVFVLAILPQKRLNMPEYNIY